MDSGGYSRFQSPVEDSYPADYALCATKHAQDTGFNPLSRIHTLLTLRRPEPSHPQSLRFNPLSRIHTLLTAQHL